MIPLADLQEIWQAIVYAFKQPDFVILGALFVVGVIGFVCGWAVCEIIAVKHQIRMHQLHGKRRDKM